MKTTQKEKSSSTIVVTIDPSLEKYRNQTLFPEKLAEVNEIFKTAKLPENKNLHRK